jgi:multidrug efflux pump subunit AcrB
LWILGIALVVALYILLAIPFRSILQPIFVMIAIPYAVLGALFGHLIMDITPSYLSIFGLLALAGVAVNDSLVMVDFINQRRRAGVELFEAVVQSGVRRVAQLKRGWNWYKRPLVRGEEEPVAAAE